MATDPLIDAWGPYRDAVRDYYEIAGPALGESRELASGSEIAEAERALQRVVEHSQTLTEVGEAQLRLTRDGGYDRVGVRLLAAGAVDIAVACESFRVCPDRPGADPVVMAVEPQALEETALDLLERADELFGGGDGVEPEDGGSSPRGGGRGGPDRPVAPMRGGGAPGFASEGLAMEGGAPPPLAGGSLDPEQLELLTAAEGSLDALLDAALDPGFAFASGAISGITAGFHISAAAEPVARLGDLAQRVGVIKRRLVRLLASGFQKLVGASGSTAQKLVGQGLGVIESKAVGLVERRLRDPFRGLLSWLIRCDDARADVEFAIEQEDTLASAEAARIAKELRKLTDAYGEEMLWTGRIAKWLSWAAPFISTLAVHVGGPLLVVGLNALGGGFVVYTLDVRVDGHGLPARVRSVVRIVNDELASLT